MSATRTRRTSSKKTAQKRGRAGAAASSRRAKGGRSTARKGAAASKRGASSRKSSTKSKTASASRSSSSRSPIAQSIALLTQDHRKVDKMFRQAERVKDDMERLRPIVEEACAALTQHSEIEERHFYPVVQQGIKETDLIAEAYVEHGSLKELIAKLQRGGRGDEEQYAAMFTVLGEYVKHHVKEEEGEIFPKARRMRADFQPLLDALTAREAGEAPQRSTRGSARASGEAQETGRSGTRGRQGRGRSSREAADGEMAGASDAMQGDVEQPRRGRRGSAREDEGETEQAGVGRDQEGVEQEDRSREANR